MRQPRIYRTLTARDGQPYVIREAELRDARPLIAHARSVLAEPYWNVTELDEFRPTLGQEEAWIISFTELPHSILLLADSGTEDKAQIVGNLTFRTQPRFRTRHRGRIGISVLEGYRGRGIGEALMRTLLDWAHAEPELERLELSVFAHNTRAINLYRKLGFTEEARLLRAFKLSDGTYYDDVMMVKWIK